jgi:hypothetical protein
MYEYKQLTLYSISHIVARMKTEVKCRQENKMPDLRHCRFNQSWLTYPDVLAALTSFMCFYY